MARSQARPKRNQTGARYKDYRKKKQHQLGGVASLTKIGKVHVKQTRVMGANQKIKLLTAETANVFDPKTKKHVKAKIKAVVENKANLHYVRRNIITQGSIVDTDLGRVKVTSRPGQKGIIDGVLIESAKAK